MRSGACPTTRIPRTCRPRTRQEPPINPSIIAAGPKSGLVPLAKHHTSHPRARPTAKAEGKRRNRAKRPRRKTFRIPRENGPGGRGLGQWGPSAPSLSYLVIHCISKPQDPLTYIYPHARHAGPRGRRTSPACGSCRRPLKRNKNQGIEKTE